MTNGTQDYNSEARTAIRSALLQVQSIRECAVLERANAEGVPELIAYVVCSGRFEREQVLKEVHSALVGRVMPDAVVPVVALPVTAEGEIDTKRLAQLPVIDEFVLKTCEQMGRSVTGVSALAAVVEEETVRTPQLHLADLILDEQPAREARATTPMNLPGESAEESEQELAISTGEPLDPRGMPKNLQQALAKAASMQCGQIICIRTDGSEARRTYEELISDAERVLGSLRKRGFKPRDKIILQCEDNHEHLAAFWGCVLGGYIPVPLSTSPNYRQENGATQKLRNVWRMLGCPAVIAPARICADLEHWAEDSGCQGFRIEELETLAAGERDQNWHDSDPDEIALILFTSGSTGTPKGVMQPHGNILARSSATAQMNSFSSKDVTLNWFPLDHVGGIVMFHIQDLYVAATQIHAPTESVVREPLLWLELIEKHRVNRTWAPNFAFALINDREQQIRNRTFDLSSLNFIMNAGEAIVAKTARRFLDLLAPHGIKRGAMRAAWGMSETCSGTTFAVGIYPDRDDASFVNVGRPIPGFAMRIVSHQGDVLREGEIGRLQVRGLCVTPGYYNNPDLNAESFSADGWFNTGDLAFLRDGSLTITGRSKDVIIINGVNYYSHEVEAVVEEVPGVDVSFTAACAVRKEGVQTDQLCIFFHALQDGQEELAGLVKRIREAIRRKVGAVPDYLVSVGREDIPKTAIGKIQRSQLQNRFAAGEFDAALQRSERATGSAHTVPSWFYRKNWVPNRGEELPSAPEGKYLLFADESGLADAVREQLQLRSLSCTVVRAGDEFAARGSADFTLAPHNAGHYATLLQALAASGNYPTTVIHCWSYSKKTCASVNELRAAQSLGCYSLLFLTQSILGTIPADTSLRLLAISRNAQVVCTTEQSTAEHATMVGLLRSIALEAPIDCRLVDLDGAPIEVNRECVLHEVAIPKSNFETAYRNGKRLVPLLSPLEFAAEPRRSMPIVRGGLYLLAGGMGGIGTVIGQFLMQRYGARLILTGRSALPDRAEWSALLATDSVAASRIKNYLLLEETGGEFVYESIDACDSAALRASVHAAEQRWGQPLSGVFQLAGEGSLESHWKSLEDHWVTRETVERFETMFHTKVYGTWTLCELLKDRPDALFVTFSSINGLFGGASFSSYSAANSFQEAFTLDRRNRCLPHSYCFNWTMWDSIGMSAGAPEFVRQASRSMGYHILSPKEALQSFQACLTCDPGQVIIGVDASNPHMRKNILADSPSLEHLAIYYTGDREAVQRELSSARLMDRFGIPVVFSPIHLDALPLTPDGGIDRELLSSVASGRSEGTARRTEAGTETEHRVTELWREVLQSAHVNADDDFFQIGGDSLHAMRLLNRIQETFGVRLPLRVLFDDATVRGLSRMIEQEEERRAVPDVLPTVETQPTGLLAKLDQLSDADVATLLTKLAATNDR